jgi:hypothetical protein
MWLAYLVAGDAAESPAAVPTLLLLVPSVIAAYAARPGPHRLTAKMLTVARVALALSAAIPFVAAALLALAERDPNTGTVTDRSFESWWLAGAILATLLAAVLVAARLFPLPETTRKLWTERLAAWWRRASEIVSLES